MRSGFIMALLMGAATVMGAEFEIKPDGDPAVAVKQAISQAKPGDTIRFKAGEYRLPTIAPRSNICRRIGARSSTRERPFRFRRPRPKRT